MVTSEVLGGYIKSICVDSQGVAVVTMRTDENPPGARLCGYEILPGGRIGPPVPLPDVDRLTPGYFLAPGEDGVIHNGPENGDLTLRSRNDSGALILRARDPACVPHSLCMGPARALAVVTFGAPEVAKDPGEMSPHPAEQFVGVFDLTSVSGDRADIVLPKVWFPLPDASSNRNSAAWLTRDARRLTVAYESRTGGTRLVNVDLSPEGRGE